MKRSDMSEPEVCTGERTLWWSPADHLKEFHAVTDWYMEAMEHCIGKRVLDLGSGYGFGSFLLSTVATSVDSYDIFKPTLNHMRLQLPFQCDHKFYEHNLEKNPVIEKADIAVAIELIEHLANPDFMLENLPTKGLFFTIPCYGNKNPYHKVEYDEEKAAKLIKGHFPNLTYRMDSRRMIGLATRP